MGNVKYNNETVKYELRAQIDIEGIASEADIVGALFGQTEGLLDRDMELKHLQRTGRIGRIDLQISNKSGNTSGHISLPSSLNKIETAIIAATLESVDRVGACACTITLDKIVDVRKDKRDQIAQRAAQIMKQWEVENKTDAVDISAKVEEDTKRGQIVHFGFEKLAAGSRIYDSDDIILVEGRADISNLLKYDIENTIEIGGTSVPDTIINLCKNRTVTAFLDGDRGGDAILKELLLVTEIDYIARAPSRKEIENLSYDEVKAALDQKSRIDEAQFISDDYSVVDFLKRNKRYKYKAVSRVEKSRKSRPQEKYKEKKRKSKKYKKDKRRPHRKSRRDRTRKSKRRGPQIPKPVHNLINETKESTKAVFVDKNHEKMMTVATADVFNRMQTLDNVNAVILDGVITQRLLDLADEKSVKLVAGAVKGDIKRKPKVTQYVTFNRI